MCAVGGSRTSRWPLVVVIMVLVAAARTKGDIIYAETATIAFDIWATDLRPGFTLTEKTINDRICFCKTHSPNIQASTTSFTSPTSSLPTNSLSSGVLPSSNLPTTSSGSDGYKASSIEYFYFSEYNYIRNHPKKH
ncbi:uncharacterized protein LOC121860319 [Homarus americanus]|uniref:Putative cell wall protein DAN4-like 2 n=1 Tax=Homarus americanus TaxID=6706 RepID=A0A8J5T7A4_HOMAM|nr:uncharacterized protein LOC121860319 [Homarus americanus]KAG7173609.1 putative cell wall protein DAN4-like 2 [Homarus americanus]